MGAELATEPLAYNFGQYRLDVRLQTLTLSGQPVALEPKAFEVLHLLIRHRERLVTKDELLDTVWRGTFVTPNVLTRAVAQLRKALADDPRESVYIQTAATRGYRFIAPVVVDRAAAGELSRTPATTAEAVRASTRTPGRTLALVAAIVAVLGAAGWLVLGETIGRDDAPPLRSRRLTSRNGYHGMAAISPDGRLIAYASERSTGLEIVVSGLDPGGDEISLTNDGGQYMQPDWSPDGDWIAFHSRGRGGLWIVPSTGGTLRQLLDFGSDPSWSPDGQRLVFSSDAGGMAAQSLLWTAARDGSDPRPLTSLGSPVGGHHDPAYSPDGHAVVFVVRGGGGNDELWRLDIKGARLNRLASGGFIAQPKFGPGGRHLYWGEKTHDGLGRLWRLSLDGEGHRPVVVLTLNAGSIQALSIARNGTAVFSVTSTDSNLWLLDAGDGPSEPTKLTDESGRVTSPHYSSDGRIAFAQIVPGNPATSWIVSEEGQHRERLVPDMAVVQAQWIGDSSRLFVIRAGVLNDNRRRRASDLASAFRRASYEPMERGEPLWVDGRSRRTTPIDVDLRGARSIRVSPDGRDVAYHVIQDDGVLNVFRRRLEGGPAVQLTRDAEAISYPAWSADGHWLAVEIKRGDTTQIGVMPADGGPVEQLTFDRGQSWPHSWTPDNDRIVFAGLRDGVWNVWTVSRSTKQLRRLTSFSSASGYVRYPSWAHTGDRVVFERAIESSSVWLTDLK